MIVYFGRWVPSKRVRYIAAIWLIDALRAIIVFRPFTRDLLQESVRDVMNISVRPCPHWTHVQILMNYGLRTNYKVLSQAVICVQHRWFERESIKCFRNAWQPLIYRTAVRLAGYLALAVSPHGIGVWGKPFRIWRTRSVLLILLD